jgi:hypothetical protein
VAAVVSSDDEHPTEKTRAVEAMKREVVYAMRFIVTSLEAAR